MAHCFCIFGLDPKELGEEGPYEFFEPKLIDYYPDINEKREEFSYVYSLQGICFMDDFTEYGNKLPMEVYDRDVQKLRLTKNKYTRIVDYTLTQASGDKKYLTAVIFKDLC